MPGSRTSLDSPAFAGRLKAERRRSVYERRPVLAGRRLANDIVRPSPLAPKPAPLSATSKTVRHPSPSSLPARQERSRVLKRQIVAAQKTKRRRPVNAKSLTLATLSVLLFAFGITVGVIQLNTNQKVKAQVEAISDKVDEGGALDSGLPSEKKQNIDIKGYRVSPLAPRVIRIAKLRVEARVLSMGVKANNEIQTPNNIYDTGWYQGSAHPGESGAVLIDGHVHGPTIPGVFYGLKNLKPGDKVSVERGDGKKFSYHVVKTQTYDKNAVDMGALFSSIKPGAKGLNLITCTGSYTAEEGYDHRVVVFAVQD
jgi:LPXTG-site transpeptidase (sortase) family protein